MKYENIKSDTVILFCSKFCQQLCFIFWRPQVDTCCVCEELSLKIKSPHLSNTNKRVAVAELMIHKSRSKKFYNAIKFDAHEGQADETTLSIFSYLTYPYKKHFI